MRASRLYAPTLREVPSEAEVPSHKLLLRAGFIRKVAGGIYTILPLGFRTINKIEKIIREEMENKGGQELLLPIIQPKELWQESGRWDVFGEEMFKIKDRHQRDFCLGPTHEEIITDLVRNEVRSYKQMPLLLYQIQNKYRDEIRPRFGLMRSREFIMKDAYSFDKDEKGLDQSYQDMYEAYDKIFTRCGLKFRPVEADGGAIGNATTHEFTVLAENGESDIAYCSCCDYAANTEKSELHPIKNQSGEILPLEKVHTPNTKTIESVAEFLNTPLDKTIKAVVFENERNQVICAFVRGDHEVNDLKLQKITESMNINMATEENINKIGGVAGFLSPIGLSKEAIIVVDFTVMEMPNGVCGANIKDYHFINVNPKRDFENYIIADIRMIQKGDPCPKCGEKIEITQGIEVGQVFKLGTKYSETLGAKFLDENGKEKPIVMGCYGIGVGRTMAASIEQNHDENGIIWPSSIAPFEVAVVPINAKDSIQLEVAEKIYHNLKNSGVDTLLDDRKERAGVKFKDCDLIGYPLRITVSPKLLENDEVEIKIRKTGESYNVMIDSIASKVRELLQKF